MCCITRHIARQRNLHQVAGVHRDGEIMLGRPAQLSRADWSVEVLLNGKRSPLAFPLRYSAYPEYWKEEFWHFTTTVRSTHATGIWHCFQFFFGFIFGSTLKWHRSTVSQLLFFFFQLIAGRLLGLCGSLQNSTACLYLYNSPFLIP